MSVVYQHNSNGISGGGATGNDVSHVTRSHRNRKSRKYAWLFPALFSYYSNSTKCSTVVQVPRLPKVTKGHVTPKLGNIHPSGTFSSEVTSSNVTSKGFPWVRCAHAQPEVAQYPLYWGLFTGFHWKGCASACATGICAISDQASPVGLPLENMEEK